METLRQPNLTPEPVAEPRKGPGPQLPQPVPQPPSQRRWWILAAVGLVVAAGIGLALFWRTRTEKRDVTAAAAIRTAKATKGDLRRTVRVSGTIAARDFAPIVAPRLRGRFSDRGGFGEGMILIKLAKPGSRVQKGDLVAEFDRQFQLQRIEDQQAEVAQAEAAIVKRRAELAIVHEASLQTLRQARAETDKARLDLKTIEIRSEIDAEKMKLAAQENAARYEQIEREVKLQEESHRAEIRALEIRRDRARLDKSRAENNAEKMVVRSPINGIIVMQTTVRGGQPGQIQEGDQVGSGHYFMQIVNPAVMIMTGSVNQTESQEFRLGQEAEIRLDAYPGHMWKGKLSTLGAMAGGGESGGRGGSSRGLGTSALYVRRIPVRFNIQGADPKLIPDLSSSATVLLREEKNAVLVPLDAIAEQDGGQYVRVRQEDGRWERRKVEVGLIDNTQAVIRSGLSAGEEVALETPPVQ